MRVSFFAVIIFLWPVFGKCSNYHPFPTWARFWQLIFNFLLPLDCIRERWPDNKGKVHKLLWIKWLGPLWPTGFGQLQLTIYYFLESVGNLLLNSVSAFRSFASQTLDKEGRTGQNCPVEWSLLVLPLAQVELEGVSLLVELDDRSALALLKDGSFVRTICAIRSISWIAFRAICAIRVRTDFLHVFIMTGRTRSCVHTSQGHAMHHGTRY